jgi:hypothetical protein
MPIVDIKNALINTLSGSDAFGADGVSTSYDVLESPSGSAVVISWTNLSAQPAGYSIDNRQRVWTFSAEIYLKDDGDPQALLDKPFEAIDVIVSTLEKDPTLGGTSGGVTDIRAFHRPSKFREVVDVGGFVWLLFNIELDVVEWII